MTPVTTLATQVDATISATVKALYVGRGLTADDVGRAIGVSHGTINSRLRCKTPWTASEVRGAADFFGVQVSDLYDGLGGTFPGPNGPSSAVAPTAP